MVRHVAILGSTGSIGVNTLDVIRSNADRFQVVALTAGRQVERLADQCIEFKPAIAVVSESSDANTTYQKSIKNKSIRDRKLIMDSPLSQLSINCSDCNQLQKLHQFLERDQYLSFDFRVFLSTGNVSKSDIVNKSLRNVNLTSIRLIP